MTLLASAADLATQLRTTFTVTQTAQAEALLTSVSDLVAAWCNRVSFDEVEDDDVVLTGTWQTELVLPLGPITDVTAVEVDGTVVATTDYELVGDVLHRSAGWGGRDVSVSVTYTHGFAEVPGDVRAVVLDRATRRWPNPEQMRAKNLDGVALTYLVDSGGLTDAERRSLRHYRVEPREKR